VDEVVVRSEMEKEGFVKGGKDESKGIIMAQSVGVGGREAFSMCGGFQR
jgi:hypothetical protein